MVPREITVLVPAHDEARRIEATLEQILAFLPSRFEAWEVLVVDDGSRDGTAELVRARFPGRVTVIQRPRRGGKGAALRAGVRVASRAWILFVDADLSIPIEELEKLLPFAEKSPIVIGSKRAPGSRIEYPRLRRALSGIGQILISTFVVRGFHDTQCGFKLYRADVARELFGLSLIDGFGFDFEVLFLARRLGHAVSEVPVRCVHRAGGSVRLGTYLGVLLEVARLCAHRARGRYPAPRPSAARSSLSR